MRITRWPVSLFNSACQSLDRRFGWDKLPRPVAILVLIGLGRSVTDLKRIAITHAHRSHLGGLAALKKASGATVYAHPWEADIIGGDRRAQPITLLPKQSLKLIPFQLGLRFNFPKHVPCPVDEALEDGDTFGPF